MGTLGTIGSKSTRRQAVRFGGPVAKPRALAAPGGRPRGVRPPSARALAGQPRPAPALQLTRRGLAVVVGFFAALFAVAAVVVVGSFLSVSDAPLTAAEVSALIR